MPMCSRYASGHEKTRSMSAGLRDTVAAAARLDDAARHGGHNGARGGSRGALTRPHARHPRAELMRLPANPHLQNLEGKVSHMLKRQVGTHRLDHLVCLLKMHAYCVAKTTSHWCVSDQTAVSRAGAQST
jgi:hypothetical protein